MAPTAQAPANPAVLAWARRGAGVPEHHAAKRAGVPVERLLEWERGDSHPSIAQLRALAELYKRPLAVFFFDSVPKDFSVMKSFRRLPTATKHDSRRSWRRRPVRPSCAEKSPYS